MESLDVLRAQVRTAVTVLLEEVAVPVPADDVFFVRAPDFFKNSLVHLAGNCPQILPARLSAAKWEVVTGSRFEELPDKCSCAHPGSALEEYLTNMAEMLNDDEGAPGTYWLPGAVSSLPMFPRIFKAWQRAHDLYLRLVLADPGLVKFRWAEGFGPGSTLPSAGVCTVRSVLPGALGVFPDGTPAGASWGTLPEDAAYTVWENAAFIAWDARGKYALTGVAGWPAERVRVLDALWRSARTYDEALDAFNVAQCLVR